MSRTKLFPLRSITNNIMSHDDNTKLQITKFCCFVVYNYMSDIKLPSLASIDPSP